MHPFDLQVHHEKYEEPYNGRNELSGCGGGMSNFGAKPALEQDQLSGSWTLSSGRSYKVHSDERIVAEASLPDRQDMNCDGRDVGQMPWHPPHSLLQCCLRSRCCSVLIWWSPTCILNYSSCSWGQKTA